MVEATIPNSQRISNRNAEFRLAFTIAGAVAIVDHDMTAVYTARFGNFVAGQGLSLRITPMTAGIKGIPQRIDLVVA